MTLSDIDQPIVNKSTIRVIQVLSEFLDGKPHGVSEIGRSLGMTKSMVHRALATLLDERFVIRAPGGRQYMLGYGLLVLGSSVDRDPTLTELCGPYMQQISEGCGVTVTLTVPVNGSSVTVDSVEPDRDTVARARIGSSSPMPDSAAGRAMLAYIPQSARDQVLGHLSQRRRRTVELALEKIVDDGIALAAGTDPADGEALAAAVLDSAGVPHCAIGVAGRDLREGSADEVIAQFAASLPPLLRRSTLLTSTASLGFDPIRPRSQK